MKLKIKILSNAVIATVLSIVVINPSFAQNKKRYQQEVFEKVDSILNIQYGEAVNMNGNNEKLLLDVFTPNADTFKKRPLLIFIHGGGFQNNTKTGSFSSMICMAFAKRGYVSATIDYRLGVQKPKTDITYFEALYRAVQDAKASVRFFRRYADKYGIDTAQIFIMGSSAGSKTAMHLAYLSQEEVPNFINTNTFGLLEGKSGNEGYSSKVAGVVNCWGAMVNFNWINKGDVPMFNVSGTADKTVPYDSSYDYHGFKYGAKILYNKLLSLGIPTGYRPFENTGHTLDNNKVKQDSAMKDIALWLYTRLKKHAPSKPEVLKWEDEIGKIEKKELQAKPFEDAYLFVGSSYIRMWEKMNQDIAPLKGINHGFGGSKLSDVAYYIDRLIANQNKLKGVVLYVGNDIVGNELDKTPLQDLELVKYITTKIKMVYPNLPIYWIEISPSEKRWAVWNTIQDANAMIKDYCSKENNVHFIEISSGFLSAKDGTKKEYYRDDKLHYNLEGYKILGQLVKKQIN